MSESKLIEATPRPVTRKAIAEDLRRLGVPLGATVLVHSSMSQLGWVAGGPQAVVLALLDVVGGKGTLVMPTHSTNLTDPARWVNPPVPASWWDVIRSETPGYDPRLTPTREMGAIVECFRHVPGVIRSMHPAYSFAAVGPTAARVVADHDLADGLGEGSPLARLYELDAWVLLLGVGHVNNTSLHLAEHRADYPGRKLVTQGSPVVVDGTQRWVEYEELDNDDSDFEAIGAALAAAGLETTGPVGVATARLLRQRQMVDLAVSWMERRRS